MQPKREHRIETYVPACFLCFDRGFILFTKDKAEWALKCKCVKGNEYSYFVSVEKYFDTVELHKNNFQKFKEGNIDDEKVQRKLEVK